MPLAQLPPMGWNSWNTFGWQINEKLIFEMADLMASQGYREAGYEYLVIDDCWSLRERGKDGRIVPDPEKFPNGMKAVADYVHSKGLKFGMYSCAGVRTCAGYPGSYDHEFVDAQTFADWGVDFLKYDFCNFPQSGNCKARYLTMSMALKATGREILFSACNWGAEEPGEWMRAIGAHMYRSTGDIMDNFVSFTDIVKSQLSKLCMSGNHCFNDMDMLTVGMAGKGNVGLGKVCSYEEYRLQFVLWCLCGVPLMMGADLRSLAPEYRALMLNSALLRINQDAECRPPYIVRRDSVCIPNLGTSGGYRVRAAAPPDGQRVCPVLCQPLRRGCRGTLRNGGHGAARDRRRCAGHDGRFLRRASGGAEGFVQSAHQVARLPPVPLPSGEGQCLSVCSAIGRCKAWKLR